MADSKMRSYIVQALLTLADLENPPKFYIRFINGTSRTLDPKTLKDREDVLELTVEFQFLKILYLPQKQRVVLKHGMKTLAEYEVEYGEYVLQYKNPNTDNKKLTRFIRRQSKNLDLYIKQSLMPLSVRYILDLNEGV